MGWPLASRPGPRPCSCLYAPGATLPYPRPSSAQVCPRSAAIASRRLKHRRISHQTDSGSLIPHLQSQALPCPKHHPGRAHTGPSRERPGTRKFFRQALVTKRDWFLKALWPLTPRPPPHFFLGRECCQNPQPLPPHCHPKESLPNQCLSFISSL